MVVITLQNLAPYPHHGEITASQREASARQVGRPQPAWFDQCPVDVDQPRLEARWVQSRVEGDLRKGQSADSNCQWNRSVVSGVRGISWDSGLQIHLILCVPKANLQQSADCRQNTWMIASSMIANGLSWWQSWLCVWIGYLISGTFICMTGRIGATYHISFPVVTRASFGIWGSLWPVFNRAAMACIWYGVQSWIGGEVTVPCKLTNGH